jgi:hypothetical protein
MNQLRSLLCSESFLVFVRSSRVKVATLIVNASLVLLLPGVIGPEGYGDYAVLVSALAVAIGTFRGPIEILLQRSYQLEPSGFVTCYDAARLHKLTFLTSVAAIGLFLLMIILSKRNFPPATLGVLAFGAMTGVLSGLRRGRLIVSNLTDRVDVLDVLLQPAVFFASILICVAIFKISSQAMPIVLGASFVVVLTVPNIKALYIDIRTTSGGGAIVLRDWSKLALSSGLSALTKNADILLLSSLIGGPAVGSYFILVRIAGLLAFGNNYANLRYTHHFARAARDRDFAVRHATVLSATKFSTAVAAAGGGAALVLAPWLLPLVQPGLGDYYFSFAMLIGAQLVNGLFGPRGSFLSSQWPGVALVLKSVNTVFGLTLLYFLAQSYGLTGAAAAQSLTIVTANILYNFAFRSLAKSLSRQGE